MHHYTRGLPSRQEETNVVVKIDPRRESIHQFIEWIYRRMPNFSMDIHEISIDRSHLALNLLKNLGLQIITSPASPALSHPRSRCAHPPGLEASLQATDHT